MQGAGASPLVAQGAGASPLIARGAGAPPSVAPLAQAQAELPPPLQAGLFAAIGWSLYLLSYDTLGLSFSSASLLSRQAARLWGGRCCC